MTSLDAGAALGRQALFQSLELYDDATGAVDERTLEIVERRRRTAVVRRRGWLVRRGLLLADLLGLAAAFVIAEAATGNGVLGARAELVGFLASLPLWIVVATIYGLYARDEERADHSTADEAMGVFPVVSVGAWLVAPGSYVTGLAHPTLEKLLLFWGAAVVIVPAARAVARASARTQVAYLQNAVILGGGKTGYMLARKILEHPEYRLNLVGMVGTTPVEPPA